MGGENLTLPAGDPIKNTANVWPPPPGTMLISDLKAGARVALEPDLQNPDHFKPCEGTENDMEIGYKLCLLLAVRFRTDAGLIVPTGLVLFEGRMGWFNLLPTSLTTPWQVLP